MDVLDIEATLKGLRKERERIEAQLLAGTYVPSPVRRVEIPKASGGTRKLGVPTVTDRWIQQAILQVIEHVWDEIRGKSFANRFFPNLDNIELRLKTELAVLLDDPVRLHNLTAFPWLT